MRLFLITLTALVAFAANSLLNRAALAEAAMDPAAFTGLRILSGAVVLAVLVAMQGKLRGLLAAGGPVSSGALMLYAVAFSFAYLTLDAGLGALILFGGVQITMFTGGILRGERPPARRWIGSALGLLGLGVLFVPGASAPDPLGVVLMLVAAFGWGIYSLRGQSSTDPLLTTAGNFVWALPIALILWPVLAVGGSLTPTGIALAFASGALASGLGYAVWYAVLPRLDATLAAIAQLSVPLIALTGGILFLGEAITTTFVAASVLIIGGILFAILGFGARR